MYRQNLAAVHLSGRWSGSSPAERAILEAASVAGVEFSAAAVAAGVGKAVEEWSNAVTLWCAGAIFAGEKNSKSGQTVLSVRGTVSPRTLPRSVYRRLTPNQCLRLHRQIGEWRR